MIETSTEQVDELPQIDTIFDRPVMEADRHDWIQQGYYIMDNCQNPSPDCHTGGIPIPSGKTLIKKDGRYDLIDERRS